MDDNHLCQLLMAKSYNRLRKLDCDGDVERKMQKKQEYIVSHLNGPIAAFASTANEQMYEVPTAFYQLVLGKRMKYSCALFATGEESIDEAEEAMLDLVCQRSQLQNGMKVMDLGCGWGALTFWILEKYKNCHVTCVSNSKSQKNYIDAIAKEKGVNEKVNCITTDVNDFDTTEKFDRVITIEMLEYITNYELLMAKISKWLNKDGLFFAQTTGHHEHAYDYLSASERRETSLAPKRFVGAHSISSDLLLYFQKDLLISKHWVLRGNHYSKCAEAWLKSLNGNKVEALEIFSKAYGRENAETHFTEWKRVLLYYMICFGLNEGNEYIVCHHLFRKRL